jgi:hypothetical protein
MTGSLSGNPIREFITILSVTRHNIDYFAILPVHLDMIRPAFFIPVFGLAGAHLHRPGETSGRDGKQTLLPNRRNTSLGSNFSGAPSSDNLDVDSIKILPYKWVTH